MNRIGSLFTGTGGLEVELLKTGLFELAYVADPDKWCKYLLNLKHPDTPNLGSVETMLEQDIPYADIIMGGSECKNFSYQGDRTGLGGKKSRLFYNMIDIIKAKQPKYVVWENVVGATTANNHKDFLIIKQQFEEAGYEIDYEIFDASRFAPTIQQRERVIILATRKGLNKVELNRTTPDIQLDDEMQDIKERVVAASKSHRLGGDGKPAHIDVRYKRGVANTLVRGWGCVGQSTANYILTDDGRIRNLTINECEHLMTWEKDFTKFGYDEEGNVVSIPMKERFNMCGNGVVSKIIPVILSNLIDRIKSEKSSDMGN